MAADEALGGSVVCRRCKAFHPREGGRMSQRRSEASVLPGGAGAVGGSPSARSTAGVYLLSWVQHALPISQWAFEASLGAL